MNFEERLSAAAEAIDDSLTGEQIRESYTRFQQRYESRRSDSIDRAKANAERTSLEFEASAYEAGWRAELSGDVAAAIESYKKSAQMDFSDAALRLASLLDLVLRIFEDPPHGSSILAPEESVSLIAEIAKWYAEAYGAGYEEAKERLERLLLRSKGRGESRAYGSVDNVALSPDDWTCKVMSAHAEKFLSGGVSRRESELVRKHILGCSGCQRVYFETERDGLSVELNRAARENRRLVRSLAQSSMRNGGLPFERERPSAMGARSATAARRESGADVYPRAAG